MNKALQIAIRNANESGHSLFSASGAPKYMACSGSVYMERDYENVSNPAADLGSDKHELAEICLTSGTDPDNYIGRIMTTGNEVDEEFAEEVRYYVDFCNRLAVGADFKAVEMRLDSSKIINLPDEGGTADFVALKKDHLFVVDLKSGYIKVPAEENEQLSCYGVSVYRELDALGLADDIKTVSLIIVQPQHDLIDDWPTDVAYLKEFEKRWQGAVQEACETFTTGKPVLTPGPKQCKWCKAYADCDAAADVVFSTVTNKELSIDEFDDLDAPEVNKIIQTAAKRAESFNAKKLGKCYAAIDFVQEWCKAVASRLHQKLEHGETGTGYKLVAGRKGARQYSKAELAEEIMKAARIKQADMYSKKLITPSVAEKKFKKQKPRVWAKLEDILVQAEGRPVIALESDPKPALTTVDDQFDDLEDDLV